MTTTAERPQYLVALDRANEIRIARAALKRRIYRGEVSLAELLATTRLIPESLETLTVSDLLRVQRRWGPKRTARFLNDLEISGKRLVGDLTVDQRRAITSALSAKSLARTRELRAGD